MCYPKPGPRCSAHALKKVFDERRKLFIILDQKDQGKKTAAFARVKKAKEEYNITPMGLRSLQKAAEKAGPDSADEKLYEHHKMLRETRLQMVEKLGGKQTHSPTQRAPKFFYKQNQLSEPGQIIESLNLDSPEVTMMMKESDALTRKLTEDEALTIRDYTQGGYAHINGYLSNPGYEKHKMDEKDVLESITLLDSALSKVSGKEVTVYRRHFFYNNEVEESPYARATEKEIKEKFAVGSVYEPGFYMSTSLDAGNIGHMGIRKDEDNIAVSLEIKTKKAASIIGIHAGNLAEYEFLTPRDAKYRVISNDTILNYREAGEEGTTPVQVIQLEEI